jgi:hypothetical protein
LLTKLAKDVNFYRFAKHHPEATLHFTTDKEQHMAFNRWSSAYQGAQSMATLFTKESTLLACNQVVSGVAPEATTVRITKGRVWLTIAGRHQDYWLYAGETMVVPAHCLIVLEASGGDARVELVRTPKRLLEWFLGKRVQTPLACVGAIQH